MNVEPTRSKPTCYTAIRNAATRAELMQSLTKLGWRVVDRKSTYHLVEELADVILGKAPKPEVDLVVVEEPSPGCRATTLARGLRELGIAVPVTVIAPRDVAPPEQPGIFVVPPDQASTAVPAIAATALGSPP
jgi:hypothetical protein